MKEYKKLEQLKKEYLETSVPEIGIDNMKASIHKAAEKKKKIRVYHTFRNVGIAAAAVMITFVILPNTSASVAMAMEKIPIIGPLVKVVTFRDYTYLDEHNEANVTVPLVKTEGDSAAAKTINKSVQEYTDMVIKQFEADAEAIGEGYQGLDISYEVITDTPDLFTLKLNILQTKASGYQQVRYYHIDKQSDSIVMLENLFKKGSDYVTILSDNIKEQMRAQSASAEAPLYFLDDPEFPENNFESISENQNFYFNTDGNLVISFDEYEVAPGYVGAPEFVIPPEVIKDILRK